MALTKRSKKEEERRRKKEERTLWHTHDSPYIYIDYEPAMITSRPVQSTPSAKIVSCFSTIFAMTHTQWKKDGGGGGGAESLDSVILRRLQTIFVSLTEKRI